MQVYWLSRASEDVPLHDDWLSARERAVLSRLRQPKRREEWRLGRWTAKTAVAGRLELGSASAVLATIEVLPESSGAPVLTRWKEQMPFVLSLSHSHELALCFLADAGSLLGCDVESVETRSQEFLDEYFSPDEQRQAPAGDCFCRYAVVNTLWSAKESVLKALGCGLHVNLLRLAVRLESVDAGTGWKRLNVMVGGARSFDGWWRVADGFAWTMVAFPPSPAPRSL